MVGCGCSRDAPQEENPCLAPVKSSISPDLEGWIGWISGRHWPKDQWEPRLLEIGFSPAAVPFPLCLPALQDFGSQKNQQTPCPSRANDATHPIAQANTEKYSRVEISRVLVPSRLVFTLFTSLLERASFLVQTRCGSDPGTGLQRTGLDQRGGPRRADDRRRITTRQAGKLGKGSLHCHHSQPTPLTLGTRTQCSQGQLLQHSTTQQQLPVSYLPTCLLTSPPISRIPASWSFFSLF
ncbi:hypothetical protein B0T22DRAFT_312604 [Podospora appendiculata]|uniref:Uncharacterized protein n=1 Tax=Podospora appendiculata TaxID=314037 RepID=A0AAE0WZ77_9PEZI|nr:hypothetical protein B0T22DRAFT_312604 [Podospora appendiculata]